MSGIYRIMLLALAMLLAAPAMADTDQRCLASCISGGQSATACMPQCSYGVTPKKPTSLAPVTVDPNQVLDTPSPADDFTLPAPAVAKAPPSHLDRVCLNDCLKDSFQFDLCKERCTRAECVGNTANCGQSSVMSLNKPPHS